MVSIFRQVYSISLCLQTNYVVQTIAVAAYRNYLKSFDNERPIFNSMQFGISNADFLSGDIRTNNEFQDMPMRRSHFQSVMRNDIIAECCRKPCSYNTLYMYCERYIDYQQ